MKNNSMEIIVLLLPIIFMLHDFEEIIMVDAWQKKYENQLEKSKVKPFEHWVSTDSGAIAVLVEFVILIAVSLLSIFFQAFLIWFVVFFIFTFHLLVHYFLSIKFHKYTPGVTTSVIFMPLCLYILYFSMKELPYSMATIAIASLFGIAVFILFFKWLIKHIKTFAGWLSVYANSGK